MENRDRIREKVAGWILSALVVASTGWAETAPVPNPGVRPQGNGVPPRYGVEVLDGDYFNKLGTGATVRGEETSTSRRSGTERYVNGGYGEYNTQQYEEWQQTCAPQKGDPDRYSDCFNKERARSREILNQQQNRNVGGGAAPLAPVPQLPEVDF